MSCNSSIAIMRMPFIESFTAEDVFRVLNKLEPTLEVDREDGVVVYLSVDQEKATFRPRKIKGKWFLEMILEYNYEDFGNLNITMDYVAMEDYADDLKDIEGVDKSKMWVFRAYVWYNGCEEPEI